MTVVYTRGVLYTLLPVMALSVMALAGLTTVAAPRMPQTQQDEYARVELLAPETASFTMSLEVAVTKPGATDWMMPLPSGRPATSITVVDMMSGQPLKHELAQSGGALRVALARPIAGEGGQARVARAAIRWRPIRRWWCSAIRR
jgi:hypothetical protein